MMKTLKKFYSGLLALTLALSLAACGEAASGGSDAPDAPDGGEEKPLVIGISQYGEHASLDNCRTGFLQGLEEAGLVEGVDYTIE